MTNKLGYGEYKPEGLPDDVWEDWICDWAHGGNSDMFNAYMFNSWWYSRTESQVLDRILRDQLPGKKPRKMQRYRRRPGLSPDDRRPEIMASILEWGGVHFGTPYGSHRELAKDPSPAKYGGVASAFVIIVLFGRDMTGKGKFNTSAGHTYPRSNDVIGWIQHEVKATVWALLNEAERRGDKVTLTIQPRAWEDEYDSANLTRLKHNIIGKPTRYKLYSRDGRIAYEYADWDLSATAFNAQLHHTPEFLDWWRNHRNAPRDLSGEIRFRHHCYDEGLAKEMPDGVNKISERDINGNLLPRRGERLPSPNGQGVWEAPDGRRHQTSAWSITSAFTSTPIFVGSDDYGGMKDFLLKMPIYSDLSTITLPSHALLLLDWLRPRLPPVKRSTVIIIGSLTYQYLFAHTWKAIENINRDAEIFFFDLSEDSMEEYLFGPPWYDRDGKPHGSRADLDRRFTPCRQVRDANGNLIETTPLFLDPSGKRLLNYVHVPVFSELTEAVMRAVMKVE